MRTILCALLLAALSAGRAGAAAYDCHEELVRMSDGVRLYGWVRESVPQKPRPVLLTIQLYTNNSCPGSAWTLLSPAVEDEMTVVNLSARGTGPSEGLYDAWGPRSADDVSEVIAWVRAQPWSNGTIVLHGLSGGGQFMMHALDEPGVAAAVPMSVCLDLYRCVFRESGVYSPLLGTGFLQLIVQGHDAGAATRARVGTDANPPAAEQKAAFKATAQQIADHPLHDADWDERSVLDEIARSKVPVFYTTANFDLAQSWPATQETRDARISFGFGHSVPYLFTSSAPPAFDAFFRTPLDRFVAHYGLGDDNGAENDPRVQLGIALGSVTDWRAGRMLLRAEPRWPLPGTRFTKVYLAPGASGSAASVNDGRLAIEPVSAASAASVGALNTLGARGDLRILAAVNPGIGRPEDFDLRAEEASALTWTSPPLAEPLELSGPMSITLYAATTLEDFDWMVRLADVWPDGRSEWITDGQLRAGLRTTDRRRSLRGAGGVAVKPWLPLDRLRPPPPGQVVEYQIPLYEASNVFQAGHRVRVEAVPVLRTGSAAGTVTVQLGRRHASHVVLPVIPSRCQQAVRLTGNEPIEPCAVSYARATGASAADDDVVRLPVRSSR